MQGEFDHYIENYRKNLDNALALSGENSAYFAEYKAQKLNEWLGNIHLKSINILDFGCGDGVMTNFVSHYFPKARVYGVDPSLKSIENAQQQFPHLIFSTNSEISTQLNFTSNFFDIVFSAGTFHHIPFKYHQEYLQELARIIKPSGNLVLFELNPLNPLTVITFKRNPIDKNATMMWPWYTYRIAKQNGPTSLKFYCFFPSFLKIFRPSEPFLTKIPLGALYATITTIQK